MARAKPDFRCLFSKSIFSGIWRACRVHRLCGPSPTGVIAGEIRPSEIRDEGLKRKQGAGAHH